jgi:uncharacterized protein YegP (UPF0339 family)
MRRHGTDSARYHRDCLNHGDPYFVLEDDEGDAIACSELHHSNADLEQAIRCVIDHAASTTVKDQT